MLSPLDRSRERIEILEEENRQLKARIARLCGTDDLFDISTVFGLTKRQATLAGMLISRGEVRRYDFIDEVYDIDRQAMLQSPELSVSTLMKHLRRKLRTFGIEVETVYGFGYRMSEEYRAAARARLRKAVA